MICTICETKESLYFMKELLKDKTLCNDPICLDCKMALEEIFSQGMILPIEFELIKEEDYEDVVEVNKPKARKLAR